METLENVFEACVVKYRHRLRQVLAGAGVRSNPAVDDDWILDRIAELIPGPPPLTIETIPTPIIDAVAEKYGWRPEDVKKKIVRTVEIMQLKTVNSAITFLLYSFIPESLTILCDGCNVNRPFEHRCHRGRAMVNGEQTGRPCQCAECFVVEHLLTA